MLFGLDDQAELTRVRQAAGRGCENQLSDAAAPAHPAPDHEAPALGELRGMRTTFKLTVLTVFGIRIRIPDLMGSLDSFPNS
jgi:hypothetical protein